ncbi:hypothetical protein F5B21DRAFT_526342 [Xylaria acuta]|nr:hypothetical protein F5B21DRAFT_526342 [Xylaria acuta]
MKVNTSAILAIAATVQASAVRRDASTVAGLLEDIFQSMTNVDNHLLNFQNDPASLHQAGFALLDHIECCTKVAEAMPPLTYEDVISIADISSQVSAIGTKFLTDLEAAAPLFAAYGLCNYAYNFSLKFAELSNKFFEANKAKYPLESQAMACEEITTKNAEFARAQAALAPGACVNQIEPGPEPGSPSLPDTEPSATTSIAYHTGTGMPGKPTSSPGAGQPGAGHNNGTHSGQPPKPIIGSASALGVSGVYWVLSGLVAFLL